MPGSDFARELAAKRPDEAEDDGAGAILSNGVKNWPELELEPVNDARIENATLSDLLRERNCPELDVLDTLGRAPDDCGTLTGCVPLLTTIEGSDVSSPP